MTREDVEVVRQPLTVGTHSRRRVEERLGLRFRGLAAFLNRLIWRLPPHSRVRQTAIRRAVRLGLEAANRNDFEAAFTLYDPEVELSTESVSGLGFDPVYHGRDERKRFQERWIADWGEFKFAPEELVDLGDDRLFVWGRIVGSGLSSGAAFDNDWAVLVTVSAGRVIRERFFLNRVEAFNAAGLPE